MDFSIIDIDSDIPLYADYFHAYALDSLDIWFDKNLQTLLVEKLNEVRKKNNEPEINKAAIESFFNVRQQLNIVRSDYFPQSNKRLVALKGVLFLPDTPDGVQSPLVLIGHGASTVIDEKKNEEVLSYEGYNVLQERLAKEGIASLSIDLNIVSNLFMPGFSDTETALALDFNQRIYMFFLHLLMLKIIAGEPIEISEIDKIPINFLGSGKMVNLSDALKITLVSEDPSFKGLKSFSDKLQGKIDFEKLGFMGHSRGANAVTRIPAYLDPEIKSSQIPFPNNSKVTSRIIELVKFIDTPDKIPENLDPSVEHLEIKKIPLRDSIKCILALEPVNDINTVSSSNTVGNAPNHGYGIDNDQIMFFVIAGTHDQDVTLDSVGLYEHPKCPKALIVIEGATHILFNSIWKTIPRNIAKIDFIEDPDNFLKGKAKKRVLTFGQHVAISKHVIACCFTSTLNEVSEDFSFFTGERSFPLEFLHNRIQRAWKFGSPFHKDEIELKDLDEKIISPPLVKQLKDTDYEFEQDIQAFYIEMEKLESAPIDIQIDLDTDDGVSNFTHFSFRFIKAYKPLSNSSQIMLKNFTIQLFADNIKIGKLMDSRDFSSKIIHKSFMAFDEEIIGFFDHDNDPGTDPLAIKKFERSILLQTIEVMLTDFLLMKPFVLAPVSDLNRVNKIKITVIPDKIESRVSVFLASLAGGILGGSIFSLGTLLVKQDSDANKDATIIGVAAAVVAAIATAVAINISRKNEEDNALVFKDFLLTNRAFEEHS